MFWKRPHEEPSPPRVDEIRDFLGDRLRLVFDFATLGAYDEHESQVWDEREPSSSLERSPQAVAHKCSDRTQAKRVAAQPHTQASAVPCEKAASAEASCPGARTVKPAAPARRPVLPQPGRRQRPGHVTAPQQPCVWPGS